MIKPRNDLTLLVLVSVLVCCTFFRPGTVIGISHPTRIPPTGEPEEVVTLHDLRGGTLRVPRRHMCQQVGVEARPGLSRWGVEINANEDLTATYRIELFGEQGQRLAIGWFVGDGRRSTTCVLFVSRGKQVTGFQITTAMRLSF